jgi:hypothetical protein
MDPAFKARVELAFAHKPEELQHLYVDTSGQLRDRHIEDMFKTLFRGDDLDDIFINNFEAYFHAMCVEKLPRNMVPGPEIYTRPDIARAWVTYNFGLLYVGRIPLDDAILNNPTFAECHYEARLRSHNLCATAVHYCYAPSELHATLLSVVNLYREIAREFHNDMLSRA